jgi:hypothetical protein
MQWSLMIDRYEWDQCFVSERHGCSIASNLSIAVRAAEDDLNCAHGLIPPFVRQPNVGRTHRSAFSCVIADTSRKRRLDSGELRSGQRNRIVCPVDGFQLALQHRCGHRHPGGQTRIRGDGEHLLTAPHIGDLLALRRVAGVCHRRRTDQARTTAAELVSRGNCRVTTFPRRRGHTARDPPRSPWRRRGATEGRSRRCDRAPARTAALRVLR